MNGSRSIGTAPRGLQVPARWAAWLVLCCLVILSAGWFHVSTARAETLPVPASAYPPHTKLVYYPTWTNQQFDCNFGWVCDPGFVRPYMHLATEDQLHRTGGWAIWAEWQNARLDFMGFDLYLSVYDDRPASDGIPWNRHAAVDEQLALLGLRQAKAAKTLPSVLPPGVSGGVFFTSVDQPDWHILFLTAWWGSTHEVEASVVYPLKMKDTARRDLISQVRTAILAAGLPATRAPAAAPRQPDGAHAIAVAVSPSTHHVFALSRSEGTGESWVTMLDATTHTVLHTARVPSGGRQIPRAPVS